MSEPAKALAPTIIIIKKKKGHGGHHGGAWKVAYADFVTAMMALFIVLWLLSSSADVKKAVGGYFQDPTGVGKQIGSGLAGSGESLSIAEDDMSQLKDKLSEAIKQAPEFTKLQKNIEMIVTGEGLRIELLESEKGQFFESGRPLPTPTGKDLIALLAAQLGQMPNKIVIEGHTDSKPFSSENGYSNWELSADRANAARRLMEEGGLHAAQVNQVRGFADQSLRKPKSPEDPSNRRVSLIVQYQRPPEAPESPETAPKGEHGEPSKKPEHGEAPKKSEHGEPSKKPEHGEAPKKPEHGEPSKKPEHAEAAKKPEHAEAAKKPEPAKPTQKAATKEPAKSEHH